MLANEEKASGVLSSFHVHWHLCLLKELKENTADSISSFYMVDISLLMTVNQLFNLTCNTAKGVIT